MNKLKSNIIPIILLAFISLIIVMQSSLNPLARTETGIDSSVFIYGGNLIKNGAILYKDFFDHKGPALYIIETIGLTILCGNTIGIWILELISMFITLCGLYKISRLYSKSKIINIISVFISIMSLVFFMQQGNFVEEYALPYIVWSLYIFIKFIKNNKVSYKEIFLNGFCLAMVILLRPNMISLWITFIPAIIYIYVHNKKIKELLLITLVFLARDDDNFCTSSIILYFK